MLQIYLIANGRSVAPAKMALRLPIFHFAAESDLFELANDFSSLSQPIAFGLRRLARVQRERSIFLFDCVKVVLIGLNGLDFTFGWSGHGLRFLDGPRRRKAAGGQLAIGLSVRGVLDRASLTARVMEVATRWSYTLGNGL
jgi:hypothetical protein